MNIEQPTVGDSLLDGDVVLRKIDGDVYAWKVGWDGCWVRSTGHTSALQSLSARAAELNERHRAEKAKGLIPGKKTKPPEADEAVLDPLLGPKKKD